MGKVVNKSFERVRKDIAKRSEDLLDFLRDHNGTIWGDWTTRQRKIYEQLSELCYEITETVSDLDEIEVPEYEKVRR